MAISVVYKFTSKGSEVLHLIGSHLLRFAISLENLKKEHEFPDFY